MKTKEHSVKEIANIMCQISDIDETIKNARQYNSELSKKLIAYKMKEREKLVWIFDLDLDLLLEARKRMKEIIQ